MACGRVSPHRTRCQWLIGYLVHRLGMKVDLLGQEIHTHGHFGLRAGCRMDGGVCRYGNQVVMFRHPGGFALAEVAENRGIQVTSASCRRGLSTTSWPPSPHHGPQSVGRPSPRPGP